MGAVSALCRRRVRKSGAISSRCFPVSASVPERLIALEQLVSDRTAGIMLEAIQGEGGTAP